MAFVTQYYCLLFVSLIALIALINLLKIAHAMGVDTSKMSEEEASLAAIEAIRALNKRVGIPVGFTELGVKESDILDWVSDAMNDPCAGGKPSPHDSSANYSIVPTVTLIRVIDSNKIILTAYLY